MRQLRVRCWKWGGGTAAEESTEEQLAARMW